MRVLDRKDQWRIVIVKVSLARVIFCFDCWFSVCFWCDLVPNAWFFLSFLIVSWLDVVLSVIVSLGLGLSVL